MTSMKENNDSTLDLRGLKVLVVDDEADVRRGLEKLVSTLNADVSTAPDGARALELLRKGDIDIVVSDIRMPKLSGIELLDAVKKEELGADVLIMTGFGTIELAVSCMAAGASHFITKPFDNHQILRILRLIGKRRRACVRPVSTADRTIVAVDPKMVEVMSRIDQIAKTRLPILIEGETGTGKELVAREIHVQSSIEETAFLPVNCAALPDTLLESELFGHRAGAFTGADHDREGLFVSARGGTVFLDEISSMSTAFQGKLLRVLQNKAVRPLGADSDVPVDFRLLAATNRSLDEMVLREEFRDDLLYRIRVLHLVVPPLRERPEDVSALAKLFVSRLTPDCRGEGAEVPTIDPEAERLLRLHSWPGNVRQLENVVIRALVASTGPVLEAHHFDTNATESVDLSYESGKRLAISNFQRRFVEDALRSNKGNVSHAADACGLTRAGFQKIMRSLHIDRDLFADD
ncbi:MAG: DNA-binding NtrC family response regulator [Planctomycetota bacterium]|jgi:DNA-binding NtrC family response regulator